jgi:acetoin utilization protein AcuB
MHVRQLMTTAPITVPPSTSVVEAKALMARSHIRHLLVVEAGRLLGIVTDRDIRLNMPSPATSLSVWELNFLLAKLTVDQIMTKAVITITPRHNARDAARLMLEHKIGGLPVVDGKRLVGIITETDLVRAFAEGTVPASV